MQSIFARVFSTSPPFSWRFAQLDAGAAPLGMRRVRIATWGNLWPVAADHLLRLEVTNVDSPYLRPSLVPSATAMTNVELSLPIRR